MCCSCTIVTPINDFLLPSPQLRIFLPVAALDGFKIFNPASEVSRQLIRDMGGHGRALEILNDFKELDDYSKIMKEVVIRLERKYPSWLKNARYFIPLLRVILSGYPLPYTDTKIPDVNYTVDQICELGLFEYHQQDQRLICPYVWLIFMASRTPDKLIQKLIFGQIESVSGQITPDAYYLPTWQQWEKFNGLFHCLKSIVFKSDESKSVPFEQYHSGALLNLEPNSRIFVEKLEYVQLSERLDTKKILSTVKIHHEKGISFPSSFFLLLNIYFKLM